MRAVIFLGLLFPTLALGWAGRGHDTICQAAPFLVKEPKLKDFLSRRGYLLGYLCNVPDVYWRSLGPQTKVGDFTHFMDPENLDVTLEAIPPLPYSEIVKTYQGRESKYLKRKIMSVADDLGSLWWRADQFFNLAQQSATQIKKADKIPTTYPEKQDANLPYNKAVYEMLLNMGFLGHFVGDVSMPFHSTTDFDGYHQGHGGIHSFYEDDCVAALSGNLLHEVIEKAQKLDLKELEKEKSPVAQIKWMSLHFVMDIDAVLKNDKVIKASESKTEKGMTLKTPAQRKEAGEVAPQFQSLIINEMAYSARLLALMWERAYHEGGDPDLKAYGSYRFPFSPEFLAPNYLP